MNELKVYRCNQCGNMVELLNGNGACLTCCGKEMMELKANTTEAAMEKHVPFITKKGEEMIVKVGEISHPMEEEHYIMWIACVCGNTMIRVTLHPGDVPEAKFPYMAGATVYAYCNKHSLWKADVIM